MYQITPQQLTSQDILERAGFSFQNWLPAEPDADNQPMQETLGTVLMARTLGRHGHEYREIEPDGTIN